MNDDAPAALSRPGPGMSTVAGVQPAALDQPFDGDSLYAVRAAVAAHAGETGIPAERIGDVVLAVHELAANAVRHGTGHGRVRLWTTGDRIRCEVTDAGVPPAAADGDRPDASSRVAARWPVEHGHGLWLVQQVADQSRVESGPSGTVAVVTFRFASRPVTP